MLKGKTESGFKFEIDESIADDMEFVEALAEVDENPLRFPKVLVRALGEEQKQRLYEHLRGKNGTVSTQKVMDEFTEMLNKAGDETKNS